MNEITRLLVERFGDKYSKLLGINLESREDEETFKWFLASILFGAPINEKSVIKTFDCFRRHDVLTPNRITEAGWDGLVKILDEGGYTRYDFKTSDKLLEVMHNLNSRYYGSLNVLHDRADDAKDLERRLKDLGKGIGNVTVGIFLRELRNIWQKANPVPTPLVVLAARNLGIVEKEKPERVLEELEIFWRENALPDRSFVEFETALLRLGKDYCRRKRCGKCLFSFDCSSSWRFKPQ